MGDVLPFKPKRKTLTEKHRGNTLCRSGFHKWAIRQDKPFDSQQGKLVTIYHCTRCGTTKIKAH